MYKLMRLSFCLTLVMLMGLSQIGLAETICFTCHKKASFENKIVHPPVAKGECNACHSPHVARFKGLLQKPVAELCFSCHKSRDTEYHKGVVHRPIRLGQCLTCHDPHASNSKGLLKGRLADNCFACHETLSQQYAHTHSPFAKGQCSACHRPHQATNYQLLRAEPDEVCASCHKQDTIQQGHKKFPTQVKGCLSCHNPHGSSRQALIRDILHKPFEKGCDECHGKGGLGTETCLRCHEGIREQVLVTHSHLTDRAGNSCVLCHSPHAGDTASRLKGRQVQLCRSCHEDTFQRHEDKLYKHPKAPYCNECHGVHGSNRLAMLRDNGNDLCSRCHKTQGRFSHPVGEKVLDPRTDQEMTCISCHHPMGTDFKYELRLSGEKDLCIQCHRSY